MGGNEEGGLENHVLGLANALAKKHEVHLIAHQKYADRLEAVAFHALDLTKSRRNPFLLVAVVKLIRIISPDIIHAQANKAASIMATLKPFLSGNIKFVATLHSLKRKLSAFEKFDWVIGVSGRVLDTLQNPKKSVIYNGVNVDKQRLQKRGYLLDELNLAAEHKLIVAMGRLVPVKRFDLLIDAFQGVDKAQLLIVGDGKERSNLEQHIKENAQENIHFLGNRKDNIEILSAADLCVISSEREGFSYVMAESLLVKTPVISTDVADMKKILPKQSVTAINDTEALRRALLNACQNYENFIHDYQPVFAWAEQHLGFDTMLKQTEQVYQKVSG
jgi:glycosyltransferase involved in cell wall biosynthesis